MASNSPNTLILAALVLLAATTPLTNATFDTLSLFNTLTVTGQVCCTTTGNCGSPPLVGATVLLICNTQFGRTVTAATGTTTATGSFTVVANGGPFSANQFVQYATCRIRVPLPVAGCTVVTTGAYVSQPISNININIFGQTMTAMATGFTAQP